MSSFFSHRAKCALIIPSLLTPAVVLAGTDGIDAGYDPTGRIEAAEAFRLDPDQLAPIRFSRAHSEDTQPIPASIDHRTEFSFQLRPARPDFSREGAFGLKMFGRPEMAIQTGKIATCRTRLA